MVRGPFVECISSPAIIKKRFSAGLETHDGDKAMDVSEDNPTAGESAKGTGNAKPWILLGVGIVFFILCAVIAYVLLADDPDIDQSMAALKTWLAQ